MTLGDTAAEIVESPITAAKITAAMDNVLANTILSGPLTVTSFNQGRSILITSHTDEVE